MLHQVGLADVAAHAVAEQEYRRLRVGLAHMMVEAGQVIDHQLPALAVGIVAEQAVFGGFAMPALVMRIHLEALRHQRFGQACITPTVFGHAVGDHQQRFRRLFGVPAVYIEGRCIGAIEPERLVEHGESLKPAEAAHCAPRAARRKVRAGSRVMAAQYLHIFAAAVQVAQALLKHCAPVRFAGLCRNKAD